MIKTPATLTTLLSLCLPLLGGCDGDAPEGADVDARAVTITDGWDLYGPVSLPDVSSCEDYWNDRCAGLSAAPCEVAHNRYTCVESAAQGMTKVKLPWRNSVVSRLTL